MQYFISRTAFVILIILVVMSGYITEILSCQLRKLLLENIYFRHVVAILMIFVFIMMEGGFSLNPELDDIAANNWSSGNIIDTSICALGIYCLFIVSSKSRLLPNLAFYTLMMIVYGLNTHVNYLSARAKINDDLKAKLYLASNILFGIAGLVLIFGFADYILYQKSEYGSNFKWKLFILGTAGCKHIK